MMHNEEWLRYLELMEQRPEAFRDSGSIHIVTDPEIVERYEERTGKRIGVRYESEYNILIVDLVWEREGEYFPYERLLPAVPRGAAVCIPRWGDRYILLRQYRHAMRESQYAFPRGYATEGLSGGENAAKELSEELGAQALQVQRLGSVVADSGISGNAVDIYLCTVCDYSRQIGYEGIQDTLAVTWEELCQMIREDRITDGFTLAAFSYLACKEG